MNILARGEHSHMVALHADRIVSVPLKEAINKQKFVDPKGEMVITAEAVGVSFCGPDKNGCK